MENGEFISGMINSQLNKLESITVICILFFSAVPFMLFVPVSAYVENISFDGDPSFDFVNCSRIVWHIDPSAGHLSLPSLRSGPIRSGGSSCVAKNVDGPARINFWWRADQGIPQVGILVFMVDNETILQCTSSNWSPVDYAVSSGSHCLRWEYRKLRSYPEYAGAGWIDDLNIIYANKQTTELLPETATCCDQLPAIKGELGRMNWTLSRLETRVGQIDVDIENLSSNQVVLEDRTKIIEDGLVKVDGSIGEIYSQIRELNLSQPDLKELVERINQSGFVNRTIANVSVNQTQPCNLSWIWENVVYVSDRNANLTDVINRNRNKIILLADGVYHTGGLSITADDVYLKSLHKGKAILDADNADVGILIDSVDSIVDNVTIDSVAISNCTNGIHIENSTNCIIINNLITDFNEIGIVGVNINDCTLTYNIIDPSENCRKNGIDLINSNNNYLLFNNIRFGIDCDDSYLYDLRNSTDNTIYVSNDGSVLEDGVECGKRDSKMSECKRNNQIIDYQPNSQNAWEFLH